MPTDKRIIRLFCMLDDHPGAVKKRADAHLHPREGVTIGLLFCLKGRRESALYRWLNARGSSASVAQFQRWCCLSPSWIILQLAALIESGESVFDGVERDRT